MSQNRVVLEYKQLYGYFECRFKASDTALASRFMLLGKKRKKLMSVDVFTYSAQEENKGMVFMDASFFTKDQDGKPAEAKHPLKKIILDMPDHPVTVGIDWTPDHLKTYVDGHVIRDLENRCVPCSICTIPKTSCHARWRRQRLAGANCKNMGIVLNSDADTGIHPCKLGSFSKPFPTGSACQMKNSGNGVQRWRYIISEHGNGPVA